MGPCLSVSDLRDPSSSGGLPFTCVPRRVEDLSRAPSYSLLPCLDHSQQDAGAEPVTVECVRGSERRTDMPTHSACVCVLYGCVCVCLCVLASCCLRCKVKMEPYHTSCDNGESES